MKRQLQIGCLVLLISAFWHPAGVQSQTLATEEVLAQVRNNIVQFRNTLPDFVCNETITSRVIENEKVSEQRIVESLFTWTRKDTQSIPKESREVLAIDGKPVRKGTKMPKVPFLPNQPTVNTLFIVLASAPGAPPSFYDYKVIGRENVGDISSLRIEFEQMKPTIGSLRMAGTAWVDLEFMQAIRTELHLLGFAKSSVMDEFDSYSILTDYSRVDINTKPYWLPRSVKVEGTRAKGGVRNGYIARYLAEYSNCHKFDTSVELKFDK
jgi:hypothetical protein